VAPRGGDATVFEIDNATTIRSARSSGTWIVQGSSSRHSATGLRALTINATDHHAPPLERGHAAFVGGW
jgi:hypothetical protein